MNFIVAEKPRHLEECPFYDYETELCHGGGYKEAPECWDGWAETFNKDKCPYFVTLWDLIPVVRCMIKDGDQQ